MKGQLENEFFIRYIAIGYKILFYILWKYSIFQLFLCGYQVLACVKAWHDSGDKAFTMDMIEIYF